MAKAIVVALIIGASIIVAAFILTENSDYRRCVNSIAEQGGTNMQVMMMCGQAAD